MVDVKRADSAAGMDPRTLPIGVSIVLYRTPVADVAPLLEQLLSQGARLVYLIDNSPKSFDAFQGWTPPPRVIVISTRRNLGYGRANNLAIRDSVRKHDYHLVCNPDITLGPQTLQKLHALLESRPDVGLCGPRVVGTDGQLHYLCKRAPSPADLAIRRFAPRSWFTAQRAYYEMRDHSYELPMEPPFVSGCFMFLRSSVLSRLDGFDERYFLYLEDVDLSRRAAVIARNLYFPEVQVVHVHHQGAHKSLRLLGYFAASLVKYFNKWGWLEQPWFGRSAVRRH
jgi:GT2 family glycosyltransferase